MHVLKKTFHLDEQKAKKNVVLEQHSTMQDQTDLRAIFRRIQSDLLQNGAALVADRRAGGMWLNRIYSVLDDITHDLGGFDHMTRTAQAGAFQPRVPDQRGGKLKPKPRSTSKPKAKAKTRVKAPVRSRGCIKL